MRAKTALTQPNIEGRTSPKIDKQLTEAQKAPRAAQAEVKRKRNAQIKAERALTEACMKIAATRSEGERDFPTQTKRVSFVVRLTLNEQGQFGRAEIEHVSSGRKQNFLKLDGDRLVSFMKACVNPENTSDDSISTKPC